MANCTKCTNTKICPCSYPGCPRHGKCCECIAYHRKNKELPACYFTTEEEKAYDRSIEFYTKGHK